MANKVSVLIDVTVDKANRALTGFKKSVSDADGAVGKFKAGTKSMGDSLKENVAPIAVAAGAAIVTFAAKSVRAASALEESSNAVNKSFGAASEGVLKVGENAAESMGLSQSAFNEAAVAFSSFAKIIGGDVTANIETLTQRAADFGSVMNMDATEAIRVFQSALAGETEPIRKFGIDLSAAAVESHALATGLIDSKSEMTEAIKVQARYSLLLQKTSHVAGDFADTSDGLANSTRVAAARLENFQARVGEELIPTVASAVGVVLDLADAMEKVKLGAGGAAESLHEERGFVDGLTNAMENHLNPAQRVLQTWNSGKDALDELTGSTEDADDVVHGLSQSLVQESVDAALAAQKTKDLEAASDAAAEKQDELRASAEDLAEAHGELSETFDDVIGKIEDLTAAQGDLVGSEVDLERATLEYADAVAAANEVLADGESTDRDRTEAILDAKDALQEQAKATADWAIAQYEANGASLTAAQKNDILAQQYDELANGAIPEVAEAARRWAGDLRAIPKNVVVLVKGDTAAARSQAREYIAQLGGIPKSTQTAILALIDRGRIADAERALNNAARTRTATIYANYGGSSGFPQGLGPARFSDDIRGATGGIVTRPTHALIGEAGPEAVIPLDSTPGSSPLPDGFGKGGSDGGGGMNLTVNVTTTGLGASSAQIQRAVIEAVKSYTRRNGPGWLPT